MLGLGCMEGLSNGFYTPHCLLRDLERRELTTMNLEEE